jgi:hypothetical protein
MFRHSALGLPTVRLLHSFIYAQYFTFERVRQWHCLHFDFSLDLLLVILIAFLE